MPKFAERNTAAESYQKGLRGPRTERGDQAVALKGGLFTGRLSVYSTEDLKEAARSCCPSTLRAALFSNFAQEK